jgi:dethiobiotin synthetase
LITGTRDPNRALQSNAELLAPCLAAYLRRQAQPTLKILSAPSDLSTLNWEEFWQTFTSLQQAHPWVAVVYPGSAGDRIDTHLSVADWAHDWRLPLLLTLPLEPWSVSQSVAFTALVRQAGAALLGFILVQSPESPSTSVDGMITAIQSRCSVPVLGLIPLNRLLSATTETDRADLGSQLDWQVLESVSAIQ